jgi:hypothetical protein
MNYSQEQKQLLKKMGFKERDIKNIEAFYDEKKAREILNDAIKVNEKRENLSCKLKDQEKQYKKNKRNKEKQAKCNAGALLLDYLIEREIISSYEEILIPDTNEITNEYRIIFKKIIEALNEKL